MSPLITSRSSRDYTPELLSGRKLGIAVHQHLGYRLHLVWGGKGRFTERCVERRFRAYEDVSSFCADLTDGGCEGLCDCVGICWCCDGPIRDKADMCDRALTNAQKGIDPGLLKRAWVKSLQEDFPDKYWCWLLIVASPLCV
jgi:hypothetical protein